MTHSACWPFLWHGFRFLTCIFIFQASLRTDIRIRIRRRIIRIRIHEPRIRVIIRITTEMDTAPPDNLLFLQLSFHATIPPAYADGDLDFRFTHPRLRVLIWNKAKPRTDIRTRNRRRIIRRRKHEPRIRAISRITTEKDTAQSCGLIMVITEICR